MDVLRTAASVLGCLEPEIENRTVDVIERLIGVFTSSLMYWYNAVRGARRARRRRGGLRGFFFFAEPPAASRIGVTCPPCAPARRRPHCAERHTDRRHRKRHSEGEPGAPFRPDATTVSLTNQNLTAACPLVSRCSMRQMLHAATGERFTDLQAKTVNAAFVLYAEHDLAARCGGGGHEVDFSRTIFPPCSRPFPACLFADSWLLHGARHGARVTSPARSTFAARVTCSTRSDVYSSICSAIGTLRGPLHGGANEAVMDMLEGVRSPEEGEAMIRRAEGLPLCSFSQVVSPPGPSRHSVSRSAALRWRRLHVAHRAMLARKELIMGFGHRICARPPPHRPSARCCCAAPVPGSLLTPTARWLIAARAPCRQERRPAQPRVQGPEPRAVAAAVRRPRALQSLGA